MTPIKRKSQEENEKSMKYKLLIVGIAIGFSLSFSLSRLPPRCHRPNFLILADPEFEEKQVPNKILHLANTEAMKREESQTQNEEGREKLVLIGVMTAHKYLNTRAVAVYNTWARSFPGKIIFFTGGNATESEEMGPEEPSLNIPLVALPGVDDSYPPQRKSFMMLK